MARTGPCYHCKTTKTKLWRKGPLDKPVLCNACGLWWKKTRNLKNYLPRDSNASETTGTSWDTGFPKEKRSELLQCTTSPIERFRRQLQDVLQQPEFSYLASEQQNDLIYYNNHNSGDEIGLGCVLMSSTDATEKKTEALPSSVNTSSGSDAATATDHI